MKEAFIEREDESLPLPNDTEDEEDKSDLEIVSEDSYLDCEDESTYFECEDEEPYFKCEDEDAAFIERVGKSDNRPTSSPECELKENDDDDHNWKLVTKKRKRRVKRREMKNENLNSTEEDETDQPWKLVTKTRQQKRNELKSENLNNVDKVQKKTETVEDAIIDESSSWKRSNLPVGFERKTQKTNVTVEDELDVMSECKAVDFKITFYQLTGIMRKQDIKKDWSSNASNIRAIRAASPPLFNSDNCPPTFEQALSIWGCEGFRKNRSSSPTESDTGISSVSALSSISDLNNLTVGQGSGVAATKTSTTPPTSENINVSTCRPDDFPVPPFFSDRRWSVSSVLNSNYGSELDSVERDARLYRRAAAFSVANCTWSGLLPPRANENPTYSCKVFLGGVPRDITEAELMKAFVPFGPIEIVWPGKDNRGASCSSKAGYNYIIFESEEQVEALLQACTQDCSNGGKWYFKISSRTRSKEVQVIPWDLGDSNFIQRSSERLGPCKTIFVGALHGMLNAKGLAMIMNDLFGGVVHAGIDTDKYKYPIGSGRVTFNNHESYMKAISTAVILIKTPKFTKRVQLDPYIEDAICSGCQIQQGPIFCRDLACFRYFCHSCWKWQHSVDTFRSHKPIMRNKKNRQVN